MNRFHSGTTFRARVKVAVFGFGIAFVSSPALGAGSNMPWEQPLQQILQSIEGRSPRSLR